MSPRPLKPRCVAHVPSVTYFKPAGIPLHALDEVVLTVDELEALRLKDVLGFEQEECAQKMNVAQSTFQRILTSARTKVSTALVQGKAIRIEGGRYQFVGDIAPGESGVEGESGVAVEGTQADELGTTLGTAGIPGGRRCRRRQRGPRV